MVPSIGFCLLCAPTDHFEPNPRDSIRSLDLLLIQNLVSWFPGASVVYRESCRVCFCSGDNSDAKPQSLLPVRPNKVFSPDGNSQKSLYLRVTS